MSRHAASRARGRWLLVTGACAAILAGSVPAPAAVAATGDEPAFSGQAMATREITATDGTVRTEQHTVQVTADRVTDLRGREVVTVRWSGARPSSNIVGDSSSLTALQNTEYPVVILQCRGDDSAALDWQHISPETCWTTMPASRRTTTPMYQLDRLASTQERAVSVPSAEDWSATCDSGVTSRPGSESMPLHVTPFRAVDGSRYWACGTDAGGSWRGQLPEMGLSSALPANERIEATRTDGTGVSRFEVRSAAENASLGCSAAVPCAIVVIPILGLTCDGPDPTCNEEGLRPEGSSVSDQEAHAEAVTGTFWFSASNWRSRVTIPLTFAPTDTACSTRSGTTVQLYGSAALSGAADQWRPAYCGHPDRFVLRINDQVETTAFDNLAQGYGTGVVSTYPSTGGSSSDPALGYAPVAVTGFAVAFVVDDPTTGKQLTELRLSPRLLAKLMTGSYPAANLGPADKADRTDLAVNPGSLQLDPEFIALNPELDPATAPPYWSSTRFTFASLIGPAVPTDLVQALTGYIAADDEAMAFIDGAPDPWGMTVNRAYRGITMPQRDWPLQDTWVWPTSDPLDCKARFPIAWFTKLMAPLSDLHAIAEALLIGRPTAIVGQSEDHSKMPVVCAPVRSGTLVIGSRAMLGLVTLADAERYGLPTASLRTGGAGADAIFVAPTSESLTAAAALMASAGAGQPFVPDDEKLLASTEAYPGTLVVHAAFPLSGMGSAKAAAAATFVRVATSEGQVPGRSVGNLPAGYAPITSAGPTAALHSAAQQVAGAVQRQSGAMATSTPGPAAPAAAPASATPTGTSTSTATSAGTAVTSQVLAAPDTVTVDGEPAPPVTPDVAVVAVATPASGPSTVLRAVVPVTVGTGLLAALMLPVVRRVGGRREDDL